jgi:hypothetical protein
MNLKQSMQQAWLQLQNPILLDKNSGTWLAITPTAIRVSPLRAQKGELTLQIGFSSYLQTVSNGKPTTTLNPILPKLITEAQMPSEIQIGVVSEIPYAQATNLLKAQMTGQKYTLLGVKTNSPCTMRPFRVAAINWC